MEKTGKYKTAYKLLKELWLGLKLSEETWNSIPCELADDISNILKEEQIIMTYKETVKLISKKHPIKQKEIIQDFNDWIDDKYEIPLTQELKDIIKNLEEVM